MNTTSTAANLYPSKQCSQFYEETGVPTLQWQQIFLPPLLA